MEPAQSVTVRIPRELFHKAKILAAKKNMSLSGLLVETLEELVALDEGFEQARQNNLEILRRGINLGTQGKANWKREDLHDC